MDGSKMNALPSISSFIVGILSHVLYFNRREHHLYGVRYVQVFTFVFVLAGPGLDCTNYSLRKANTSIWILAASFFAGLYLSLLIYRTILHPLRKFPGPMTAKISSLLFSFGFGDGRSYSRIKELHDKHGDFVRIGSSDLSITHPEAIRVVYGSGSKCTKAAWYDLSYPKVSLQTYRVRALHDARRRVWISAFSDKALRGYERRICEYQNSLFAQIDKFEGRPVNVSRWFNFFSFDVMGDLAFGSSFKMLENDGEHWAIQLLNEGLEPLKWMFPMWFFRLMIAIPGLSRDWWRFMDYCAMRAEQRRQHPPEIPDIMSSILAPLGGKKPEGKDLDLLNGDSQLVIVAGSDTTAATLTHILLELCRHPEHIDKLREEFQSHVQVDEVLHSKIFDLEHLNGVIYETLRLHPPVPTALPRKTPPEGVTIGETYVPGDITVYCPQYAIGRKEEIYTRAISFVPERWYLNTDMVKEPSAWAPFSTGPYGCAGRPLAMMTLRTTVVKLLMRYDFSFSNPDNGRSCEQSSQDHFTLAPGALDICFKKRAM